ncbi:hypothetical protein LSAT2_004771 [Lamellibrachia satsuma]|nr:hypothetical protein LSAT2_004771 [Lamellibrachia satsuma]
MLNELTRANTQAMHVSSHNNHTEQIVARLSSDVHPELNGVSMIVAPKLSFLKKVALPKDFEIHQPQSLDGGNYTFELERRVLQEGGSGRTTTALTSTGI